jgi:hypothetical protein
VVAFSPTRYTLLESSIPFSSRWTIKQAIKNIFPCWERKHMTLQTRYILFTLIFLFYEIRISSSKYDFVFGRKLQAHVYRLNIIQGVAEAEPHSADRLEAYSRWSNPSQFCKAIIFTKVISNSMISYTFCLPPIPYSIFNSGTHTHVSCRSTGWGLLMINPIIPNARP